MNISEPFATVESADSYFSARAYSSGWTALADDETKAQYLNLASVVMRIFSSFTPEDADAPVSIDDPDIVEKYALSSVLEAACLEEALHLVNLGKDPTQTLKVLNLGILSTDGTVFDHSFVADILCPFTVRILKNAGFEISSEATGGGSVQIGIITK